ASPPQQAGESDVESRLLGVQTLEDVQDGEREQDREGELPRPAAPPAEIERGYEQPCARRQGQRVEERHSLDRLEPEEQVPAPADVRRQRRDEIDGGDQRRCPGGQRRKPGLGLRCAERGEPFVHTGSPSTRGALLAENLASF